MKRPDRSIELLAFLCVVDCHLREPIRHSHAVGRRQERTLVPQVGETPVDRAAEHTVLVDTPDRSQRIERPRRLLPHLQGLDGNHQPLRPPRIDHHDVVDQAEELHQIRPGERRVVPGGDPLATEAPHERPGHETPTELFVHHYRIGPTEPVGPQREHARFGQLGVHGPVEPAPHAVHGESTLDQGPNAVPQRPLIVGQIEVHRGSRGRPRTRSPRMLR